MQSNNILEDTMKSLITSLDFPVLQVNVNAV